MNINEHLALKVMGWREDPAQNESGYYQGYYKSDVIYGSPEIAAEDWKPTENLTQAFMCLEKFDVVDITKSGDTNGRWCVTLNFNNRSDGFDESLPKAISLACAKATGWKE